MFERRRQAVSALHFNQACRELKRGERVPAPPGLADQIQAYRADVAKRQSKVSLSVEAEHHPVEELGDYSSPN